MLRLVLDNSILNQLSGQAPLPGSDLRRLRRGLKRKAAEGQWQFVGNVLLIEEMCGIRSPRRYSVAFSLYWDLIQGRLLRPWNDRIMDEMQLGRPLKEDEVRLEPAVVAEAWRTAARPKPLARVARQVQEGKSRYASAMKEMTTQIKRDPRWGQVGTARDIQQWFGDWKEGVFELLLRHYSPSGRQRGPTRSNTPSLPQLENLPATRSCAWFLLTKLFEHLVLGRRVDRGDQYDMSYYVDAAPCGYLVTEDRPLIDTCRRMPQRRMGILRLKALAGLLGERGIVEKLRRS